MGGAWGRRRRSLCLLECVRRLLILEETRFRLKLLDSMKIINHDTYASILLGKTIMCGTFDFWKVLD